ncbi:hypothetical protein [Devosia ginsengisoli]|uniref:hypothetical protein n=1 Tax=Devosia ginsengisoli TaxID=400770 RepID=UPI0026EB2E9F|nr:hypothetical protein [Devosia ginsengisoli]MCR6669791.1 hypothetical protein [Devosia ginsengisoli]
MQGRIDDNMPSFGKSKIPTSFYVGPEGYPCQEPHWGELVAVSAQTGISSGGFPLANMKNWPPAALPEPAPQQRLALRSPPPVGSSSSVRPRTPVPGLRRQQRRRAWTTDVGINALATPLTYLGGDGDQYVVAVVGGGEAGFTTTHSGTRTGHGEAHCIQAS